MTIRSRSRRQSAVSVARSLGQRRGVERAASWPRRQPRQARSAQCVRLWAVGWFSTGRRARGPRATGLIMRRLRRSEAAAADLARCRWRRASANGVGWSASRVGRADNRAKHAARRDKCSVGGRLVLHVTKRARAARHGTRTRRQRRFEAAAADKARCRWRGASANGVGWSAPRVGRADNRAKHAARSACSVGGRLVLHGAKRARAARHGTDNETATTVRSRSRRPGAVSVEKSFGQRRGVERVASWPRRQPRQARSAQRQVLCGRSAGYPRGGARARRAPRDEKDTATTIRSRSRRQSAVSVARSLGQRRGVERVASWPRRQPRQARSAKCMLCGRSAGSPRDEARAGRAPRD